MFFNHCVHKFIGLDSNCYNSYSNPTVLHGYGAVFYHFYLPNKNHPIVLRNHRMIFEIIKSFISNGDYETGLSSRIHQFFLCTLRNRVPRVYFIQMKPWKIIKKLFKINKFTIMSISIGSYHAVQKLSNAKLWIQYEVYVEWKSIKLTTCSFSVIKLNHFLWDEPLIW